MITQQINLLANHTNLVYLKHMFRCCLFLNFPLTILLWGNSINGRREIGRDLELLEVYIFFLTILFLKRSPEKYFASKLFYFVGVAGSVIGFGSWVSISYVVFLSVVTMENSSWPKQDCLAYTFQPGLELLVCLWRWWGREGENNFP